MSDDVKQSWHDLGEQMSELGTLVKGRFTAPSTPAAETDESAGESGDESAAEGASDQIKAALDQVVAATRELGERIGDVARDDEVRSTAKVTMTSLDEALRSTVDFITDQIEGAVKPSHRDDD
jgi:hypothetical protein